MQKFKQFSSFFFRIVTNKMIKKQHVFTITKKINVALFSSVLFNLKAYSPSYFSYQLSWDYYFTRYLFFLLRKQHDIVVEIIELLFAKLVR